MTEAQEVISTMLNYACTASIIGVPLAIVWKLARLARTNKPAEKCHTYDTFENWTFHPEASETEQDPERLEVLSIITDVQYWLREGEHK